MSHILNLVLVRELVVNRNLLTSKLIKIVVFSLSHKFAYHVMCEIFPGWLRVKELQNFENGTFS